MLFQQLTEDLKNAMKEKNTVKLEAVRLLFSQVKKEAIDAGNRDEVSDDLVIKVAKRRIKQGKDSLEKFKEAGREDLIQAEEEQMKYIEVYLPEMLSEEEIEKVALVKKEELGITDKSKMGQLMGILMKEFQGQADGTAVKNVVEKILS